MTVCSSPVRVEKERKERILEQRRPTVEGIRENRDELIEKAVEVILAD